VRRILNRVVHAVWRWVDSVGTIVPGTARADAFARFGRGSAIGFPIVTLFGESHMRIGEDTMIGRHCTLTVGYDSGDARSRSDGLIIGDRCVIGARGSLTALESIVIEDDVWFGQDVLVTDSGHGYQDPKLPIGVQLAAHEPIRIGAGSWIGHGAMILGGTTLGRNVVVAAGSVVRGEFEDRAVIGGVPAKVLRRHVPGTGWVAVNDPDDVRPEWRQPWEIPVVPGSSKVVDPATTPLRPSDDFAGPS
jgi:acetyltransferase-like isoleucine patch superfamily enzyme